MPNIFIKIYYSMFKISKLKIILFLFSLLNAIHYLSSAYIDFCDNISSFCIVSAGQKLYIFFAFILFPLKLVLYPFDLLAYSIIRIDFLSFFISLALYWILISVLLEVYKKNRFVFFILLSFLASITLGIAVS